MSTLPPELVGSIIDLSDDWRTLAACVFVHPDWEPRARSQLRRGVLAIDWPACPDVDDFFAAFCPGSSLASDIFVLFICGRPDTPLADFLPLPSETLALDGLPNLWSLTISTCLLSDVRRFLAIVSSCASLEELRIESISVAPTASRKLALIGYDGGDFDAPAHGFFPRLKTLRIRDIEGAGSTSLFSRLSDMLGTATPPVRIQALSLHFCTLLSGRLYPALQLDLWEVLVQRMQDTLTDISFTVSGPLDLDPRCIALCALLTLTASSPVSVSIHFPLTAARCPDLRHFAIRYRPPPGLRAGARGDMRFLPSLNGFLLSSVAQARGAFQKLEVFTLVLPYPEAIPDSQPYEAELVRLGRMLTRNTFPALRLVRIGAERDPAGNDSQALWQDAADVFAPALHALKATRMATEAGVLQADDWEPWGQQLYTWLSHTNSPS